MRRAIRHTVARPRCKLGRNWLYQTLQVQPSPRSLATSDAGNQTISAALPAPPQPRIQLEADLPARAAPSESDLRPTWHTRVLFRTVCLAGSSAWQSCGGKSFPTMLHTTRPQCCEKRSPASRRRSPAAIDVRLAVLVARCSVARRNIRVA